MKDDPFLVEIKRLRRMAGNINSMIESVSLLSSFTVESRLSETNVDFFGNIDEIRGAFRRGDLKGAESRVNDIVRSFGKYKKESLTMYARFTNMVKHFPTYAEVLTVSADALDNIRSQIMEDKVTVYGEEDLRRIAESIIKLV